MSDCFFLSATNAYFLQKAKRMASTLLEQTRGKWCSFTIRNSHQANVLPLYSFETTLQEHMLHDLDAVLLCTYITVLSIPSQLRTRSASVCSARSSETSRAMSRGTGRSLHRGTESGRCSMSSRRSHRSWCVAYADQILIKEFTLLHAIGRHLPAHIKGGALHIHPGAAHHCERT